jgi:hypothetical protein
MPIESDGIDDTDSNDGPHCRNCHVGASNCDVCHADVKAVSGSFSAAYTPASVITTPGQLVTSYSSQSYIRQSAVAGVGGACLDGGFSFPHRTLGANMLKDELYGINFDGSAAPMGTVRSGNTGTGKLTADSSSTFSSGDFDYWTAESRNASSGIPAVSGDSGAIEGASVENLDSVCIDCHGDSTYYNASSWTTAYAGNGQPLGNYGSGASAGFELLLKGLP